MRRVAVRPPFRTGLAAAVAVLALAVALGGMPTRASAESEEAPDPATITTTLQPGWNMVAWLGPEAPVTDLFGAIPGLERVSAWDAAEQRYQRRTPTTIPRYGLRQLTTGMGLWLRLGGDEAFEWTRSAWTQSALLPLHAGRNLVGWVGRDGTPIADAVERFGESLVRASQWDAAAQAFEHYQPGDSGSANTLAELNHGDALWVVLTADARWSRSGAHGAEFTFPDGVSEERQASVRADTASVVTFFAERYGIEPPVFSVVVDLGLNVFAGVIGAEILIGPHALESANLEGIIAHEYFHVLQPRLGPGGAYAPKPSPPWMTEGSATYVAGLYWQQQSGQSAAERRVERLLHSQVVTNELRNLERSSVFTAGGGPAYSLASLAVEWLSGYAAADSADEFDPLAPGWPDSLPDRASHITYYRELASAGDWDDAFETAFGLSPDDFYESFEAYRSALTARTYPHLADDSDEPVLILVGEMPTETQAAVRTRFASIVELFGERLAAGSADYTVYIGADAESLADVHLQTTGNEVPDDFCNAWETGVYLIATVDCIESSPRMFQRQHSHSIRERLAPWGSLEAVEDPYDRRGPHWLLLAIEAYADHADETAIGHQTLDEVRAQQISLARGILEPLSALAAWDEVHAAGFWKARALSSIAGELLADRASEVALFDYFRQLPEADTWQAAFEAAFGMSVDDFHVQFEAHRAAVVFPLPHLADDSDEPVLILVGEIPPEREAAVRTAFADIQRLFGERLEAGSADYTAYIGADAVSLADVHSLATGKVVPEGFCSTDSNGVYVIATVDCVESSPRVLQRHHSHSIRARLAPLGSLPPAEQGHDRRGPLWLLLAIEAYADHAYETAIGHQTLDEIRAGQTHLARRLEQRLSTFATWDDLHAAGFWNARALSSIAGELLADRASEVALFDYFRQLPEADTWQAAFEAAFAMSVEDFHAEFEAHRAEVAPPYALYRIRGVVLDPAGNAAVGAWVGSSRGEGRWENFTNTGEDGAFELAVRDGRNYLHVDLSTTGCSVPTDGLYADGIERVVDGADVSGVDLRLPEGSSCDQH